MKTVKNVTKTARTVRAMLKNLPSDGVHGPEKEWELLLSVVETIEIEAGEKARHIRGARKRRALERAGQERLFR